MNETQLTKHLLDQNKDLIWIVNLDLQLTYANKAYLNLIKEVTGEEKKLNESVLVEGFGEGYIEKWKAYYNRALSGDYYEIEEHYFNAIANEINYSQITFEPLLDKKNKIFAVACQSKDITHLRKKAQEAGQLINASLDVFCTIDEQGKFVYVSDAAISHWGYAPSELIGTAYQNLIVEEDIPKTIEAAAEIISGNNTNSFINRYTKKNGGIAYNLWSVRWDAVTKLLYCVARDGKEIVEQKEKMQQSEERFKALVQDGSDLISITDLQGNYIYMSPTSTIITGFTPEEFIGKNVAEFIHPDDAEKVFANVSKLETHNKIILEPFRTRNKKNEWRWAETVLTNMLDNPTIKGIVGNTRDVTEKIEEKHKLKLFESVITNTNDAILITEAEPFDEPGPKIIYVNEAFTQMTGYSAEEVIGKSPRILQGPNSNKEELKKLGQALRKWESYELTTINYKKNGEEFWINFTVTPVADEKGWYTHWIAIERDVTVQKNKELEKELLAQISVNFNTENDYLTATKELCKSISKFGKFDWVELWTSNLEKSQMQLFSHYLAAPEDEKFYDSISEIDILNISESLAGKVWTNKKQILWDETEISKNFVRKDAALKIGLKAVLGIPLIFNHEVVGIIKIGSKNNANYLKNYIPIFQRLERFIGSELNRKKLENDVSHLFNAIPDILCLLDLRGRFLKINKTGCSLLGFNQEDILYHSFEEFVHPLDKGIFTNEVMQLEKEETTFAFENRYITKSGEIIWLSWNCNSTLNEGIIYATASNITEEKKLRELNRITRSLAKIGSWEVDLVNTKLYWSEEVHQLHETNPTLFAPDLVTAINFYRDDFRQMVNESIEKSTITGAPFDFEAVIVTTSKKELWVRVIGNVEFVKEKCVRIFGSFQDINERKQAELRLQSLADNLPGVVFQYQINVDGTDSLKYVTKASKNVWGFEANEVIENNQLVWNQIKAGGDLEQVTQSILISVETKNKWTARWKYVMPNGEIKIHLGYGSPVFLADGTILFDSVILDITNEAKNEDLLEQVSKLAKIGSWRVDLIENLHYWSNTLHSIFETDSTQFVPNGENALAFYREDFREIIQKNILKCIEKGAPIDVEAVIITANKNEKWVRLLGNRELIDGKPAKLFGSLQDITESKKAETLLIESENKFRSLIENSSDMLTLITAEGRMEYISPSVEKTFGYTNEENRIRQAIEVVHPDDVQIAAQTLENAFKNPGIPFSSSIRNRKKDGTYIWVEGTVTNMLHVSGVNAIVANIRDITEQKKAEEDIRDSEEKRRLIMSGALDAIICIDTDEIVTFWNPQAEVIFGWKEKEVLGKHLSQLIIPEAFRGYHNKGIKHYLKTGEGNALNKLLELKAIRRNGAEFPIELTVIPVKQLGGVFFCAFIRDITERKKAQESIIKSNERFEKVTQATNDAIWDWDMVNKTFYRSQAFERFFNKEAVGMFTDDELWAKNYFHPEDLNRIKHSFYEAIENSVCKNWDLEYRLINELGQLIYVIDRAIIIRNPEGKAIRIVGAMTDVTEQKQMTLQLSELNVALKQYTTELERSNEELEQFAFIASHDLQEPLRMISSFMDLLQQKYGDKIDAKGQQYIGFATEGAKRMKQIILDLLEYSRAGRLTEGKEEIDLNEIINDFMQSRRKLIAEKNTVIISNNLPKLNSYKAAITQILHCLLDNALKYCTALTVPTVEINALELDNEWQFFIKDNGIGIDSQFYEKIFVIFQRLHNKNEYAGTGIGLSIAKRHIEFLGGKIWLDSELGKGTTFYFTISKTK